MQTSRMKYDYSTKNFHRYTTVNGGTVKEVYIPRSEFAKPLAEISVDVQVTAPIEVAEKAKPAKER